MTLYASRGRGTHNSNEYMTLYNDRRRGNQLPNDSMAMYTRRGGYTNNGSGSNTNNGSGSNGGYYGFESNSGSKGGYYNPRDPRDAFGLMHHSSTFPCQGSINKSSTSTSGGNNDHIDKKEQHVANTPMANTARAHMVERVHLEKNDNAHDDNANADLEEAQGGADVQNINDDVVDVQNINDNVVDVIPNELSTVGHVIVLVYVDNLLITGSDPLLIQDTKQVQHNHFKINDLGELRYFLGIELCRSSSGIVMSRRKYALELISKAGLTGAQPVSTPLELTLAEYGGSSDGQLLHDVSSYQRLVGKLLYLTNTRPDIAFTIQTLSQYMQQPKISHWNATMRVIRYIKGNPGLGNLSGLDFVMPTELLVSVPGISGYLLKFGDSLISWKSKKQNIVSRSSPEAEYRSLDTLTAEVIIQIRNFPKLNLSTLFMFVQY
uniref:Reverse transcriptase Ty1/copia-type domain-containing protein n=1 Tax=Solanum lycopersicum TaxID=4081 RepID=A0A3Q7IG74_SOLLC